VEVTVEVGATFMHWHAVVNPAWASFCLLLRGVVLGMADSIPLARTDSNMALAALYLS
jgi:hypothetical protein